MLLPVGSARFEARQINWQRDFFDHRLRGDEGWREKSDYILRNPFALD